MGYKVDNAVIMAAGTSSRFAPLSYEVPKALISVKGEVLIERQIKQLKEAGIEEIIVVVGYKKEQFFYLKEKYGVVIVENDDYDRRNNNSSIYAARKYLKNSYICSADNYFTDNPFEKVVEYPYYAALYSKGYTKEWCIYTDKNGYIDRVQIGGSEAWYMIGHVFWNKEFSDRFIKILLGIYNLPQTENLLWESIYTEHLDELKLKIKKYSDDFIFEFDSLDELRQFDKTYVEDTRSQILRSVANDLNCSEADIGDIEVIKNDADNTAVGFRFSVKSIRYIYNYEGKTWRKTNE